MAKYIEEFRVKRKVTLTESRLTDSLLANKY